MENICNSCLVIRVSPPRPRLHFTPILSRLVLISIWYRPDGTPTFIRSSHWFVLNQSHTKQYNAKPTQPYWWLLSDETTWTPSTPPCKKGGNSNHWAKCNNRRYIISVIHFTKTPFIYLTAGFCHCISNSQKNNTDLTVKSWFFVVVLLSSDCGGHVASPVSSHSAWRAYSKAGARKRTHHPPPVAPPELKRHHSGNLLAEWKQVLLNKKKCRNL